MKPKLITEKRWGVLYPDGLSLMDTKSMAMIINEVYGYPVILATITYAAPKAKPGKKK